MAVPLVRLRVSASAPAASLSVKLCDVSTTEPLTWHPRNDDLAFCDGSTLVPLVPGEVYDVALSLDACAYRLDLGQRLRLSIAGSDWPNTVAPPAPVTLMVHGGTLAARVVRSDRAAAGLRAWCRIVRRGGRRHGLDGPRDVLRRTTDCTVRHGSTYQVPHDDIASEE